MGGGLTLKYNSIATYKATCNDCICLHGSGSRNVEDSVNSIHKRETILGNYCDIWIQHKCICGGLDLSCCLQCEIQWLLKLKIDVTIALREATYFCVKTCYSAL